MRLGTGHYMRSRTFFDFEVIVQVVSAFGTIFFTRESCEGGARVYYHCLLLPVLPDVEMDEEILELCGISE